MTRFQSIIGALAAGSRHEADQAAGPRPFITISRQAGAGGHTLQERLLERLSAFDPAPDALAWTGVDKELVEMVAGDDKVFGRLVDGLGEQSRSWLEELFADILTSNATEFRAYRKTAKTIRALALRGRVIIVGRGGVFITRDMPLGVHIHLVAPLEDRIDHMRRLLNVSRDAAAEQVRTIDRNREAFFKRYWPSETLRAESFTATFNTAQATDAEIADAVLTLIPNLDVKLSATPATLPRQAGVFQRAATS
ncbi:MAG: cytidylate kinase-like family protein [Phycisphaeraceae bacterium]